MQSTRSREKYSINSEKIRNDDEDTVGNILYNKEETDLKITKKLQQRMWNRRNRIKKRMKKERGTREKPNEKRNEIIEIKKKKEKQEN